MSFVVQMAATHPKIFPDQCTAHSQQGYATSTHQQHSPTTLNYGEQVTVAYVYTLYMFNYSCTMHPRENELQYINQIAS